MAVGDYKEEEFTDEEKAALGEEVKTDEGDGAGKTQEELDAEAQAKSDAEAEEKAKTDAESKSKTEEEQKPDAATQAVIDEQGAKLITENGKQYVVDDEGAKIPLDRFKKVYGRSKELEREKEEIQTKHNLFKQLGAEKYYEIYPTEKPADFQPAKPPENKAPVDIYSLRVNGGQYDGYTLKEVAEVDSVAAQMLVNSYYENERNVKAAAEAQTAAEIKKQEDFYKNFEKEKNAFLWERGKELFSKDKDYTPEEIKQVNVEYERLSQWMITNKKVHYSLEDAYLLANKDAIFKRERTKAAEAALKKATDKTVGSIGKGDPNSKTTGFDNYLSMSEDDLTKKIDGFTDAEATKFFKEAPKALKDKFPSLPW